MKLVLAFILSVGVIVFAPYYLEQWIASDKTEPILISWMLGIVIMGGTFMILRLIYWFAALVYSVLTD